MSASEKAALAQVQLEPEAGQDAPAESEERHNDEQTIRDEMIRDDANKESQSTSESRDNPESLVNDDIELDFVEDDAGV